MIEPRRACRFADARPRARRALAIFLFVSIAGVGSAAQPSDDANTDELVEEIEALVANVYDQRMARQYNMGLELPRAEVEARLDVFGRWLDATRRGVFPKSSALPEGLVERYEKVAQSLSDAGATAGAEQLDAVLLFLEQNSEALQKASGLEIVLPM